MLVGALTFAGGFVLGYALPKPIETVEEDEY